MGSFGASIFVLFVLPDSPFAQPRNVILGHFVTTLIGSVLIVLVALLYNNISKNRSYPKYW